MRIIKIGDVFGRPDPNNPPHVNMALPVFDTETPPEVSITSDVDQVIEVMIEQ